jgi:predicted Zn-dependent protease
VTHWAALFQLGRFKAAISSLDRAIALQPDELAFRQNRAATMVAIEQIDEVLNLFDRTNLSS